VLNGCLLGSQNVRTLRHNLTTGGLAAGFWLCRAAKFPAQV
jgi:hypothetical protein